ncbi:MAG: alpha/beta hydrolase [Eubacterium sp.]|nr:alpha/beta hydrolase [Eubacterium sp.]
MSKFTAFVIKASGRKKMESDPVKCDKYIEKRRAKNKKPFMLPPFPYASKVKKESLYGVETVYFNKGRDKKIIYLHGGAFTEQPLLPHFMLCDKISKSTGYEIIFPVYKKAPDHTFTETLDFLETLYRELIKTVNPESIVFMGDSSGGGLALSFCEYLKELSLPQPKRMVLLSPWLDVSMATPFNPEIDKVDPNLQYDFLKKAGKNWAGDTDVHDWRVSPIYGDLSSLAPITAYFGTWECIIDDARIFRDKCKAAGAELDYREYEGMNHVFPLYPIPEAKKAHKEIIDILT